MYIYVNVAVKFTTVHYVLRFGGTPFISMEISFQALKFEFDMPIPNVFCHNFVKS